MENGGIRIELVTNLAQLKDLSAAWETLWAGTPGARWSQHPTMCGLTVEAALRKPGHRLSVVTAWRGTSLIGVLPLVGWSRYSMPFFAPPTAGAMETASALIAVGEDAEALAQRLLDHLAVGPFGGVVQLPFLRADMALGAGVLKRKSIFTIPSFAVSEVRSRQGESWDEYLASKTGKEQLRIYKKRRRQLNELGEIQCENVLDRREKIEALEWLFKHKLEWIARENKYLTPFFSEENFRFMSNQLDISDVTRGFAIYRLTLDGKIIAVQLICRGIGIVELLAIVHDFELNKFSPGRIILEDVIEDAFDNGLDVDFGFGDEEWKKHLYNYKIETLGVTLLVGPAALFRPFLEPYLAFYGQARRLRGWVSRQMKKLSRPAPALAAGG